MEQQPITKPPVSEELKSYRQKITWVVFGFNVLALGIWNYVVQAQPGGWFAIMVILFFAFSLFSTKSLQLPKNTWVALWHVIFNGVAVFLISVVISGGIFFAGCLFGFIR